jgi:hypothetical protein
MHLASPPEYVKLNGTPSESLLFLDTENRERSDSVAATIKQLAAKQCLPGQTHFPKPDTDSSVLSSRTVPFGLMNFSGLKTSGSGYTSGPCVMALRTVGDTATIV